MRRVLYAVIMVCFMVGLFAFVVSKASASPEAPLPGIFATKSAIVLDDDANGLTQAGDRIRYTVRITNTASTSFTNVYVIDQLAPGAMNILTGTMSTSQGSIQQLIDPGTGNSYLRADLGTMNGNSTITIVFDGRILTSAASPINNTATVYQIAGVFIAQTNTTSTALVPGPDLRATLYADTSSAYAGKLIKYDINSIKWDSITATGIMITEVVPANTVFVASQSTQGWSCGDGSTSGTTCALSIGDAPGYLSNHSYFAVQVNSPLTTTDEFITNVVRISDDGSHGQDTNIGNNIYTSTTPLVHYVFTGTKSISFVRDTYQQGVLEPDDEILVQIVVTNTGTVSSTSFAINDQYGSAMALDLSSPSISKGVVSCQSYATCSGSVPALSAGEFVTMGFRLTATNNLFKFYSEYNNLATVQIGYDTLAQTNVVTVPVAKLPDLVVRKYTSSFNYSETVKFGINYENLGSISATNVILTETFPTYAQFNATASDPGWVCVAYTCTYSFISPVAPYANDYIFFGITLLNTLPASVDTLVNTVYIGMDTSEMPERDYSNNSTSASALIGSPPVLTATTSFLFAYDGDLDGKLSIGDIVTFTTVVRNIGDRDANEVNLYQTNGQWMNIDKSSVKVSQGYVDLLGPYNDYFYAYLGKITAGGQVTLTWSMKLNASPPIGLHSVSVSTLVQDVRYSKQFDSIPASVPLFSEISPQNFKATKTAKFTTDTLNNGTADVGDVIEYAIVVTNTGSTTACDVKVIDCFQGSVAGCSYYPSYWTTLAENGFWVSQGTAALNTPYWQQSVTTQFGSLTPGDVATLTLRVVVTNALPTNATQIINQAQVYAFSYPDPVTVTNVVTIPVTPRIALSAHTSFYQRIITDDTEVLVFSTYFSDDGNYTLPYQVGFTQSIPSGMKIYWPASSFYLACNGIECWFGMPWSSSAENNIAYIAFSRVLSETQNASLVTTTAHAFAYQSGTDEINYADNFSSAQAQLCAGPYEFNNTRGTANVIQAGEVQSQGFCYPYNWQLNDYNSFDEDWAVFTVTTPAKYQFGISTIDTGNWWLYSSLTLFAEDGTTVLDTVTTDWPNYNKVEFTKILFPGKYYVRVKKNGVFYGNSNQLYKLYVLLNQPMRHTFLPNTMRTNSLGW